MANSGSVATEIGVTPVAGSANAPNNDDHLSVYLQTMGDLVEGDPVLQADVFMDAQAAAKFEPTTTNRLNYALALATPGHPSSNAREAQRLLSGLLTQRETLPQEERILALVHLKEVEQRLILDAQAQRLQEAVTATTEQSDRQSSQQTAQSTQSAEQLQSVIEENQRLQTELDDAREKLDAITNIERSIRERESSANP